MTECRICKRDAGLDERGFCIICEPEHELVRELDLLHRADLVTAAHVRAVLMAIRDLEGDYEKQHQLEDELHFAVLCAISEGRAYRPAEVAQAATESRAISFPRYTA